MWFTGIVFPMNNKLIFLPILVLLAWLVAACSGSDLLSAAPERNPGSSPAGDKESMNSVSIPSSSLVELSVQSSPEGMYAFKGRVFVASTHPANKRWQQAGWQVATKAIVTDGDTIPEDCTLYPHQGVDNQWIGSCVGNILIPQDGADHIAVMHTREDGTTSLIQVAPPPVMNGP
jgi:hypothetical protein